MNSPSINPVTAATWSWPASYWVATATPAPATGVLAESLDLDCLVIGAGFTGLRAALCLAEAGRKVAVIDACDVGWGASGRNGGQVNPLPPLNGPDEIAAMVGPERLPLTAQAMLGSGDETFGLIRDRGIDCGARQNGWIRADHCDKAKRQSRSIAEAWRRHGAEIEFLDGEAMERASGTRRYRSGTLMASGGALHPLSYARGLARAAQGAGAAIYSGSPARSLTRSKDRWQVRTPQGAVTANQVLLCTNGYSDGLWPGLARSVIPLVSIQAATEPLDAETFAHVLPGGRTIADTRRTILYGRHEPDGRILFGSIGSITGREDPSYFEAMNRELARVYPALKGVRWEHRWSGRIAVTQDHLPHLHEPAPGLIAGLGYNGRGVAMSTVMGRILAERALGKEERDLPFPVSPIRAFPFYGFHHIGADWVTRWMRFRDNRETAGG